jgi:hypothetical protein
MSTIGVTVVLAAVGAGLGVVVPRLSLQRSRARARERELTTELRRHREIIADYEATIRAYRQFVHDDPELALTSR